MSVTGWAVLASLAVIAVHAVRHARRNLARAHQAAAELDRMRRARGPE